MHIVMVNKHTNWKLNRRGGRGKSILHLTYQLTVQRSRLAASRGQHCSRRRPLAKQQGRRCSTECRWQMRLQNGNWTTMQHADFSPSTGFYMGFMRTWTSMQYNQQAQPPRCGPRLEWIALWRTSSSSASCFLFWCCRPWLSEGKGESPRRGGMAAARPHQIGGSATSCTSLRPLI